MSTSRRDFLRLSAVGSAAALGAGVRPFYALAGDEPPAKGKLKLLVLGGTQFLGPAIVEAAKARGHTITLFNRGKTRPTLFPEIEKLRGDRDPKKGDGIKALEGRKWDAVIDDCGYYPRMVKASAELLSSNIKQYVFISSISAYAKNDKPGSDEDTAVGTMADPTVESMGASFENYGPLKALCEQAAEKACPGRATIVRPGYIVGPEDPTDRFTYWPLRIARAKGESSEVLIPGTPKDPIQIIDARDLGRWLVHSVEKGIFGVFNACGPEKPLEWGHVIDTCKSVTGSEAKLTWVDSEFLQKADGPPIELPIWLPPNGETAGFHRWSNARIVKAGMTFRPVKDTIKDTLEWFKTLPTERQEKVKAGPKHDREAELLAAWHKRQK